MTRTNRNSIISTLITNNEVSKTDSFSMLEISNIIGDDDEIEIDYDDIGEILGIGPDEIYFLLEEMYDLGILEVFLAEDGVMG